MKSSAAINGNAAKSETEQSRVIQIVSEPRPKIVVLDTCVLVHDPRCFEVLRKEEKGARIVVPWVVTEELDVLKVKADIGYDAREAIRQIEIDQCGEKKIEIRKKPKRSVMGKYRLNLNVADYEIIATGIECRNESTSKKTGLQTVMMSLDTNLRVWSRELDLEADEYAYTQVDATFDSNLKEISISSERNLASNENGVYFQHGDFESEGIGINEGVICKFVNGHNSSALNGAYLAIYKGDERFRLVTEMKGVMGLTPFTLEDAIKKHLSRVPGQKMSKKERKESKDARRKEKESGADRSCSHQYNGNGKRNWQQHLAFEQLLDPSIELVFLQGGAGTGKTLIAIASAIQQRDHFEQIIITRPAVHLEDHDSHGFLPGSLDEKMSPWLTPIKQAQSYLFHADPKNKGLIMDMEKNNKIIYESLDFIRGQTFHRSLIVIDEAQNLTPHQVKTIITRTGLGTKMIFTGDLGQIDRTRRLDRRNSGLAYAMSRMGNKPTVAIVNFKETVRSHLASLAEECL